MTRRACVATIAVLAGGMLPAQAEPPPWWQVSDNDTVSISWLFAGQTLQAALAPTNVVAPGWFTGAPWRTSPNLALIQSIGNRQGIVGIPNVGNALMATDVDNDPRIDWVKLFWSEEEFIAGGNDSVTSRVLAPAGATLRNVQKHVQALPQGWTRLTIRAQIFPQPDVETGERTLSNQVPGTPVGIDRVFTSTRCVPKSNMDATGPIGTPIGTPIAVESVTGNSNCIGVCFTDWQSQPRYWVSATGLANGQPHLLYEFSTAGQLLATHNHPTTVGNPSAIGMRDLAVGGNGRLVYGGMDAIGGPQVFVFDVQTKQFLPGSTITLQAGFQTPHALAFNPDGDLGNGSLWTSDLGGAVHEFRLSGQLIRTVNQSGGQSIAAAGYDRITGRLYWFARQGTTDPRNIQVVGTEFDVATLAPTGVGFYGDLNVAGTPVGGTAGGFHYYRLGGHSRLLCLAQGAGGGVDTIYEIDGPFEYGQSCAGATGMSGVPHRRNPTWQITLSGLPGATLAALKLGFSRTSFAGFALPFDLGLFGLPRCAVLAAWDIDAGSVPVVNGSASITIRLPGGQSLAYAPTYWQWVAFDPTATGGVAVSQAGGTVLY